MRFALDSHCGSFSAKTNGMLSQITVAGHLGPFLPHNEQKHFLTTLVTPVFKIYEALTSFKKSENLMR